MSISQEAGTSAAPVPHTPTQLFVAGRWRDAADGATFALGRHRGKHRREDRHHHVLIGGAPAEVVIREEMDERG